ncbi:MAG TPA: glycosyltransferase 87 family protein [Candidatus Baltobacteraceae bacterium]
MIAELRELDSKVGVWLAIPAGLTLFVIVYLIARPVTMIGNDFQAFWCGANALLVHANPYLNEPLRTCEAAHSPSIFRILSDATTPAPLPPYGLSLFVPLALLPFVVARAIWWAALGVAAIAVGRGISKVTGMPPITALAASTFAVCAPGIVQGALSPIPIALLVFSALALQRRQWNAATLLLGFAMIEPNMTLPACAAIFLVLPQMRLRLFVAGLCAALLTLLLVGPGIALAYFTAVLPAHAASEVNMLAQDSLTTVLYHLGIPAQTALLIGSLQYFLLAAAGIYLARLLSHKDGDLAWLVLLPAAFAVMGGSYIHVTEVAMAIPLACLLVMRRPTMAATLAVILLAMTPEALTNWALLAPPAALTIGWFMARSRLHPPVLLSARLPVIVLVGLVVLWLPLAIHFWGGAIVAATASTPWRIRDRQRWRVFRGVGLTPDPCCRPFGGRRKS